VTDPSEEKVFSDIATHGWHMISVPADEHGPGFTYTIGLYKSHAHPELIIFGLPTVEMQRILDVAVTLIKGGRVFRHGEQTEDVLNGYACAFRDVRRECYADHLGYAMWFYRTQQVESFPAQQCVWPDKDNHFPWQRECGEAIRQLQPSLYETYH
jgi:hypothetical protein